MKTIYKKVFRELLIYKNRTFVAILGILIGLVSIGSALVSNAILTRELDKNYMDTNPASMTLKVSNLDPKAIDLVKAMKRDLTVEVRKTIGARIDRANGQYGTIYLYAIEDFNNISLDKIVLEKGAFPKGISEMALERDSLKILDNVKQGYDEKINIKLPGGYEKEMYLSARVHAAGLAPASMEKYSYGFLTLEALQNLGYQGWYDEIRIISMDNRFDRESLRTLAAKFKDVLLENGYIVSKVDVPVPGKHPHGDQLNSLMAMLQIFTMISLFVACVIIINLLNFIMSTQRKQIAIMKTTGAKTWDIALPYLLYVMVISSIAILISFPIILSLGAGYSGFAAGTLNFEISSYSVPPTVPFTIIALGLMIPLFASIYPILRSCSVSVKEGLTDQDDTKKDGTKKSLVQRLLKNTNTLIAIPANNLFRKKGRTALAILALAAGGIMFMTSLNIIASIGNTVDKTAEKFTFDTDVRLYGKFSNEKISSAVSKIEGIENFEMIQSAYSTFKKEDGTDSSYYIVKAYPENSKMMRFDTSKLSNVQGIGVIISNSLANEEPWLQPGMSVTMDIGGKSKEVYIADIVNEIPPIPSIYIREADFNQYFGGKSMQEVMIKQKDKSVEEQLRVARDIEKEFKAEGIEISEVLNVTLLKKALVEHLQVIINLLIVLSLVAVVVGGLSISSAISINIIERKRELGIQRAVGATSHKIIMMNAIEAVIMGVIGWLAGFIVVYPISYNVGNVTGEIFLQSKLNNIISIQGIAIWLIISVMVSLISGLIPARKAAVSPLREMLSYE
jgi:putative ABC transport system permease protein